MGLETPNSANRNRESRLRAEAQRGSRPQIRVSCRRGTAGVGTSGVTAKFTFSAEGIFGTPASLASASPEVPGRTFFQNL